MWRVPCGGESVLEHWMNDSEIQIEDSVFVWFRLVSDSLRKCTRGYELKSRVLTIELVLHVS